MDSSKTSDLNDDSRKIQQMSSTTFYVQRLKVAVALAVIRTKPSDMSSEDYAKTLSGMLQTDIESWKKKCRELENEVLSLEQRLQTVKLKEDNNLTTLDAKDLLPRTHLSCDNHPYISPLTTNTKTEQQVIQTLDFVRNFVLLGKISSSSTQILPDHDHLKETILKSVSSLLATLRSDHGLEDMDSKVVAETIFEIHRLMDCKQNCFEEELVKACLQFVDEVLLDIHRTTELNQQDKQHKRSILIQMLSEHRSLTIPILSRLLREITIITDFMQSQTMKNIQDFRPLLKMENAYFVLQSAEGVANMLKSQKSQLNAVRFSRNLLAEWEKTTRNSLLGVGSRFPMLSLYVWHIHAILKESLVPIVVLDNSSYSDELLM